MAEPRTVRENANTLTSEEIAAILPHRYPFALVDRILDYEPGGSVGHWPQVRIPPSAALPVERQDTIAMMISCLCSYLFTVLHTLGIENIL